ncbi:MAG: ATP synthase epsilon chain (EC [uncultured Sulfurovum sp.]|uniref:ATP synthase epsilon chain n=1 Tax=uncultured Sulfurovum sp. TaxID=269237 RepID=A0A6S6T4A1_9BACT|nr:MAG: ATP synthase epsilon chain (EC [uncultured Sulfurovum sp.]
MELIKLEIISPEGIIYSDNVQLLTVPGDAGEFGILAGHASVLSLLNTGVISIQDKNNIEIEVAINGGYVHVVEHKVLCMVDGAIALSGDDNNLARAIAEAKALLEKAEASPFTVSAAVSKFDNIKR